MATMEQYIEDIKLELTGDVVELEISDTSLAKFVNRALKELQSYIDITKIVTVPYSRVIDTTKYDDVNDVTNVMRATPSTIYYFDDYNPNGTLSEKCSSITDPIYANMMLFYGLGIGVADWSYNLIAFNTMQRSRNMMSTDLNFRFDGTTKKLYINISSGQPTYVTLEYVPVFKSVDEIVSPYWTDILGHLATAYVKEALGRIRSKYTQNGALYTLDGATLLSEGREERNAIVQNLRANNHLIFPMD